MLTLLYPELISTVLGYPIGLYPLIINNRPMLVVKGSKEMLLTSKTNKGFKMYIVPIEVGEGRATVSIISAFFDDHDEPLCMYTPLDDLLAIEFKFLVLSGHVDVHLFDECSRELLGYSSIVDVPTITRIRLEQADFLPFSQETALAMLDEMPIWFGQRSRSDDAAAITLTFVEALFSEDLFIQDLRPEYHTFQGSCGFSHTTLVRHEPGRFQEHDIVHLLHRIFPPEQIYLSPLRASDHEEISDIIVITSDRMLLIQAKDSPNTEQILRNTLDRKKATALKSLKKAIEQVKGTVRYTRSHSPIRMIISGEEVEISIDHLELTSLIIIKEMFSDQYMTYSPLLLELAETTQVPCIALDYLELNMYTAHLASEEAFFEAYNRVFAVAVEKKQFPRLRFVFDNS